MRLQIQVPEAVHFQPSALTLSKSPSWGRPGGGSLDPEHDRSLESGYRRPSGLARVDSEVLVEVL